MKITMNNIIALQTSRKESIGVPGKNTALIQGKKLFQFNLDQALKVDVIDNIFTVSNIEEVLAYKNDNIIPISLPEKIANANHYGAIRYGIKNAEMHMNRRSDIVIILLGNSIGAIASDLKKAVEVLVRDPSLDSVCSVSKMNAYNPARAFKVTSSGKLNTIMRQEVLKEMLHEGSSNERNILGDALFFNGSFWVCRRDVVMSNSGMLPFPWLGQNIYSYLQDYYLEVDEPFDLHIVNTIISEKV